jgi:RsiW-degrading membrane proteinase PrsW (M82 family)
MENENNINSYIILTSIFTAGLDEELFKFLILASVCIIPKYEKSKSAILQTCVMTGLSFGAIETFMYGLGYGCDCYAKRIVGFPAHFLYTYVSAIALTRQRDEMMWVLEMIAALCISITIHALHNIGQYYMALQLLEHDTNLLGLLQLAVQSVKLIIGSFVIIKLWNLPKDHEAAARKQQKMKEKYRQQQMYQAQIHQQQIYQPQMFQHQM